MKPSSHRPARLRERLREETARAILAAAEEVFAAEGLGARMERIAAAAGVAVGTLYNHFEDRAALVAALVRSRREALLARVDAALAAARGQGCEAEVRAYLGAVEEHARTHGALLAVLMQGGEGPGASRPPRSLIDELVRRADALVARGAAAGDLREDDAKAFGLALVGLARAVLLRALAGGAPISGALARLFLEGARR